METYYSYIQEYHEDAAKKYKGIYDAKNSENPKYHWAHTRMLSIAHNVISKHVNGAEKLKTMVDVGCGNGDFLMGLANRKFAVDRMIGCDFTQGMLRISASKMKDVPHAHFVGGNILSLPFPDKFSDVTTCLNLLHVVRSEDLEAALTQLSRITRRYLYIDYWMLGNIVDKIVVARGKSKGIVKPTLRIYPVNKKRVLEILRKCGFEPVCKKNIFVFEWLSPKQGLLFKSAT